MFKTALPPGWIGKSKIRSEISTKIWITFNNKGDNKLQYKLTDKQFSLLEKVKSQKGEWQSTLIKQGFSSQQINTLISKGILNKTKRQKAVNISLNSYKSSSPKKKIPILTLQQKKVIKGIQDMKYGEALLLWGETGSCLLYTSPSPRDR